MVLPDHIFKAYDIRGLAPDEFDESLAEKIGRAFVTFVKPKRVVIGYDARLTSPSLAAAVGAGVRRQGADVLELGFSATDYFYYACAVSQSAGLMITASHNPKDYNGVKLVKKMPFLLSGEEGIKEIKQLVTNNRFPKSRRAGNVQPLDLRDAYRQYLLALINPPAIKPFKVVADAANGAAGVFAAAVYASLPIKLTPLYFEPDGNFPNHGLDPLKPENRQELQARVKAEGADVGFAFDGDGDRFFVIDDLGEFVPGDFLTALLAQVYIKKHPGAAIIYDVRSSWCVKDLINAAGGRPLMNRVGHAFIKRRMLKEDAVFGGEVSGHYYFKEFFNADSGLLPSLKVLELLSAADQKMSALLAPLRKKYFISGEINLPLTDRMAVTARLKEKYRDGQQYEMDGLSVEYPDWHFNVRPSNTEPLLRLNLEALKPEILENKKNELLKLISQ